MGIIKNKKNLAIVSLFISVSSIIIGQMLDSVYYGYRESAWERMTNYISKEINNGNEKEVSKGIQHIRENYSE